MSGLSQYLNERRELLSLLLLSLSALFLELALIRWIPGSVRVAGYFTNLILIASFLGLGTGAILSRFEKPDLFRWWPLCLALLAFTTLLFGALGQANPPGESEFIWAGGPWHWSDDKIGWLWSLNLAIFELFAPALEGVNFYFVITVLFVGTAAFFTLLGHRIGRLFERLPPLRAYGYDLGGSVLGVFLFTVISRLEAPPIAWFAIGAAGLAVLSNWRGLKGILNAILVGIALVLVLASSYQYHWSPYYKIEVSPVDENMVKGIEPVGNPRRLGYRIRVNNDYHQTALDLSEDAADVEFVRQWRSRYDIPYKGRDPGRVLVLGAGGGNDVQAALRNGASHVTAVEIDPRLSRLGTGEHPERPYSNDNVTVVVDDARSFLKSAPQDAESAQFDTIVFGFLDSHTLMTSFSTLRIDNYVYTVESLTEAMQRLKPGGRLCLSFASVRPFLGARLHRMVELVSGDKLVPERLPPFGHLFAVTKRPDWEPPTAEAVSAAADIPGKWLATDDWPFLYLQAPAIPTHYLYFMALVILLGFCSFMMVERSQRRLNLEFFFLGAGFLLLETRSVTEIALLFGSTWEVNAVAFGTILLAVLGANFVVQRWSNPPRPLLYAGVVALLLLGYALPPGVLHADSVVVKLLLVAVVLYSPIFLAGLVFSSQFRGSKNANLLFGSNLLGAMTGGALEYFSLMLGLSPIYLIGALLYLAAFVASRR